MAFHRRLPLYTRPILFLAGWAMLAAGVAWGFNWIWETTVFSGSILIQTKIPTQLIVFAGMKAFWLVAALVGLALLVVFSYGSRGAAAAGGWWAPKWRFYPLVLVFGLFLAFFGAYWLFDLRFAFDDTPGGFVMFTSLNYAGLVSRPFIGTLGFLLLGAGALLVVVLSLDLRIPGLRASAPPVRAAAPEPVRTSVPVAQPRLQVVEPAATPPAAPSPSGAPRRKPPVARATKTSG